MTVELMLILTTQAQTRTNWARVSKEPDMEAQNSIEKSTSHSARPGEATEVVAQCCLYICGNGKQLQAQKEEIINLTQKRLKRDFSLLYFLVTFGSLCKKREKSLFSLF